MLPVPFFKGLEGPNRGRGTGYWASTPASTPVRRGGGRPAGAGAPVHSDQQSGMKPVKLGKGRPAGATDRKNMPATPVRLGKGRPAGAVKEGTGYSDEEVKSGKQRSGRPYPEAKFPGWKVGKNMLTQKVKNGKKIGVARTIAAVKEETERAAEARHKRLMKMDIPGTFGDRDLRERIRRKQRERQAQRAAAKAAAAKKSGY